MNIPTELIKSLQNPAIYPHSVDYFRLIETHISWVLLTGKFAYKIKKPLNLGFLDFSSLAKRHHYCLEELRLNSRLAADIYLEVVAITGTKQQPSLIGKGVAFEYALKMRQFEADKTFDQLLIRHQISDVLIRQTAKIIAAFHDSIAKATSHSGFGDPSAIMQSVQENFSQILQLKGCDQSGALKQLSIWSKQQYCALQDLFMQRQQTGFVRECHGDLHLGNIALINSQVVPFDGIEFNPFLYWIDVISDIAFLMMDLQGKQRNDLAFQFLNEYLQYTGDYHGLTLLRFYLVYRAMVRAKVCVIRASQCASAAEQQLSSASYHSYLQLATRYSQTQKPWLMIMHGVSGSGKSGLSEKIISRYQVIRIRSDIERKRMHKLAPQQQSHSAIDCDLYSPANSNMTYQRLLQLASEILNAGYNVIVDATFLQQQQRELFFHLAIQIKIPFLIVSTKASRQSLLQRILKRVERQDNISEADQSVLDSQFRKLQPLNDEELKYCFTVDTDKSNDLLTLWTFIDDHTSSSQQK